MSDVRGISVDANAYLQLWQERCRNHPTRKNVGLSAVWAFFQDVSDGSTQDGTHTKVKCVICDKVYSYKPSTGQHHITNHMLRSCPLHEKLYRSVEASIAARKQTEAKSNVEREKKTDDERKAQTQGKTSDGTQKSDITKENATFDNHGCKSQNNKRSGDLSVYLENWKEWARKQEKAEVDAAWGMVVERGNNGATYFECLSCKKAIECTNKDSQAILEHANNHPLLYKHLQVEVALLQRNMENGSCQSRKRSRTGEVGQVEVSEFVLTNFLRVWENSCKQHPTRKNTGLAPVWAFFEKTIEDADAETAPSSKSTVQCLVCGKTYAYSPSTGQSHIKGHMKKADSLHATLYAKLEEKVKERRRIVAE